MNASTFTTLDMISAEIRQKSSIELDAINYFLVKHTCMLDIIACPYASSGCTVSLTYTVQVFQTGTSPSPALKPEEVVRTVLEALEVNDAPSPDAGLKTLQRFSA